MLKVLRREGRASTVPLSPLFFAYETLIKSKQPLEQLVAEYPGDLIFTAEGYWGPFTSELQEKICDEGTITDDMGVVWKCSPLGIGPVRISSPLDNWDNLDNYIRNYIDRPLIPLDKTRKAVTANPDTFVMYTIGMGLFEQLRGLLGTAETLTSMYLHRKEIDKLREAFLPVYFRMIRKAAQDRASGIWIGDDFGTQRGSFMNPSIWREVFGSWYQKIVEETHRLGMVACLHSCGNVREIIPDIIEIGFDSLHPIQPRAINQKEVAKEFHKDITFCTGGDVQGELPLGTPEQVREQVKKTFEIFDRAQGGFIFMVTNTIMPETPLENIRTMIETAQELSKSTTPLSNF